MILAKRLTLSSCIALLLVAFGSFAQTDKRAERRTDTYEGLHISIYLDKASYRFGDLATLRVVLTNVGDSPITIYKGLGWGCLGSLGYGLTDSRGRGLMPTFIPGSFYSPPFPKEDFITLKPGEAVHTQRRMQIGRQEGIRQPGTYQVTVWYNNPVSQDFAPEGVKVWRIENEDLVARRVRFTVTR